MFGNLWKYLSIAGLALSLAVSAEAGSTSDGLDNPSWVMGGLVVVKPKYEGSENYEVVGAPYLYPSFGGLGGNFSIRGADDIRYRLFNSGSFYAGPLAGYDFGRDEEDGARLGGLGDIDGGVILGAFAGYRVNPWLLFDVSYHRAVSGDVVGGRLRFGLEVEAPVSSRVTLLGRVGATFADEDYMAAYFGVSSQQSMKSTYGLTTYDAGAGIKDVHLKVGTRYQFDDRWTLKLTGQYSRLLGDAADSPIVETEDQFTGAASITYKLGHLR